jgi:hypothetical protein
MLRRIGARYPANSSTAVLPDPQEEQAARAALVLWLSLRLALSMCLHEIFFFQKRREKNFGVQRTFTEGDA